MRLCGRSPLMPFIGILLRLSPKKGHFVSPTTMLYSGIAHRSLQVTSSRFLIPRKCISRQVRVDLLQRVHKRDLLNSVFPLGKSLLSRSLRLVKQNFSGLEKNFSTWRKSRKDRTIKRTVGFFVCVPSA